MSCPGAGWADCLPAATIASRDQVDVWQVSLDGVDGDATQSTLSDPEREHAARLRVGGARWTAARAALRRILGGYLGLAPHAVELQGGSNGKPRLVPGCFPDLRFSLSHSDGLALIAVRLGHEVGVDLERVREGVDGAAIERDVFGSTVGRQPFACGGPPSGEAFFRRWTRREALAKASGLGVVAHSEREAGAGFTVMELGAIPGFAAALASEGNGWRVKTMPSGSTPS